MARPRTEVGTFGAISTAGHVLGDSGRYVRAPAGVKATRWRARTKYRDSDGVLRDVETWAPTKAGAVSRLKQSLADRQAPTGSGGLRASMTVADAGALWLEHLSRSDLSQNTLAQYRGTFERHVLGSTIASLTLREANRVPVLDAYLRSVADGHGRGSARTARSIVSGILRLAVRHEAIDSNRMRDAQLPSSGRVTKANRDTDRTFTAEELRHVLATADTYTPATTYDVADLVHFLAGTGARISEALGTRWADLSLWDETSEPLERAEVHIRGTKTDHADRRVPLPDWLADRLRARAERAGTAGVVFCSPGTTDRQRPRDKRNVTRQLRALLDQAGMPWATAHTFRATVGHMVTVAQGATAAANVLGHSNVSMTLDHYSDRRESADGAARTLSGLLSEGA